MTGDRKYPYFWIPEEDVTDVPLGPPVSEYWPDVRHDGHGMVLSRGLRRIRAHFLRLHRDGTVPYDDQLTFKLILQKHVEISRLRGFIEEEGMRVNAMRDSLHAVVTASQEAFERLVLQVQRYQYTGSEPDLRYIAGFSPFTARGKQAESLRMFLREHSDADFVDAGIMMLPKLTPDQREEYTARVTRNIRRHDGRTVGEPYELTDGTQMLRAVIPLYAVSAILADPSVYRAEKTSIFRGNEPDGRDLLPKELGINPSADLDALPEVVILDDGVDFPPGLRSIVKTHWAAKGVNRTGKSGKHGTPVASRAAFADLGSQIEKSPHSLTPRARIIDAKIVDAEETSVGEIVQRIKEAVSKFKNDARIFNLSYNAAEPGFGKFMSELGAELDQLAIEYGVRFTISAGNYEKFQSANSLAKIFTNPDTVICEPADAMLGTAVGSAVGETYSGSVSGKNEIAPYSRRGPGYGGYYKPDLAAYGGAVLRNGTWIFDRYGISLNSRNCSVLPGTSFTAPAAAGDLAQVMTSIHSHDIGLAQALLYHGAVMPDGIRTGWMRQLGLSVHDFYGLGLSSPLNSMCCSENKAVFLQSGTIRQKTMRKVRFHIPQAAAGASRRGGQKVRVTVTCLVQSPVDFSSTEYTLAYISVSIHWLDSSGLFGSAKPVSSTCRKWDIRCHFRKEFSDFSSGDWELWLEPHARGNIDEYRKIPYALAITVEDPSGVRCLYSGIIDETDRRYRPG